MLEMVKWTKSKKPTLEELKEALATQGLECELYSDPPRVKYGRHKHPFDDFVVIVMKPGDRLNIPANTPHSAEVLGRIDVQYLSAAK
jgi:hypothetical protein